MLRAAFAGEGAGQRAVRGHGQVGRGFLGPFRRVVGEFPFAREVTLGRIFRFFRFVNRVAASVDEDEFNLGLFVEQIAVGDHEIGDLAVFDRAETVADTEDFRRRQRERAQRGIRRETCFDRLLHRFENILRRGDAAGIKGELHSRFGESRG